MKASRYNIFFPYTNKMVGFNGLSQDYIVLENELYELYLASVNNNEMHKIKEFHPDLDNYLLDKKFIVEESFDEFNEVAEKTKKIDFDDSIYELHINPTMNCNFECWYCYENHIKDSKLNPQMVSKIKLFINNLFKSKPELKTFSINWFGGEPLLFFDKAILPILDYANNLCKLNNIEFYTLFTTNGLLLDEKKLNSLKRYNVYEFQITLDGHRDRHNKVRFISQKKGSYDRIVKNIINAAEIGFRVSVRINYSKDTFDGLENIIDDFEHINDKTKNNLIFDFHQVWQENTDLRHERDLVLSKFKEKGFNISTFEIYAHDFTCYADKKNNANINYNGDIYKCTARDYTKESREGVLNEHGNIEWNNKYYERLDSKFKNKPCFECKILPICKGGCSQLAVENKDSDYCVYHYDEQKKIDVVINHFKNIFYDS